MLKKVGEVKRNRKQKRAESWPVHFPEETV